MILTLTLILEDGVWSREENGQGGERSGGETASCSGRMEGRAAPSSDAEGPRLQQAVSVQTARPVDVHVTTHNRVPAGREEPPRHHTPGPHLQTRADSKEPPVTEENRHLETVSNCCGNVSAGVWR